MALAIAVGGLQKELEEECPFKDDRKGASEEAEQEELADDYKKGVQKAQANNGGTLGKNLSAASNGTDGTWRNAPFEPSAHQPYPPKDSKRRDGIKHPSPWAKVLVPGTETITASSFPYTVAAHHLIPGNASLYNGENDLQDYMIKGKTVKANGKSFTIKYHIGYNVNGAHNGVWLPGNYAIRKAASPTGVTWGKMGNEDWQLNYVAACAKVAKGQFHDAHTEYNDSVRDLLNAIAVELKHHQCHCKLCQDELGSEVPPPYLIKGRLYHLSRYLKANLTLTPSRWRRPWFASDRWRDVVFKGSVKPCDDFVDAFKQARRIEE